MQNSSARPIAARTACKPKLLLYPQSLYLPRHPPVLPTKCGLPLSSPVWWLDAEGEKRASQKHRPGWDASVGHPVATLEHQTTGLGGLPISPGGTVAVFAVTCYLWLISCEHRAAIKMLLASGGGLGGRDTFPFAVCMVLGSCYVIVYHSIIFLFPDFQIQPCAAWLKKEVSCVSSVWGTACRKLKLDVAEVMQESGGWLHVMLTGSEHASYFWKLI